MGSIKESWRGCSPGYCDTLIRSQGLSYFVAEPEGPEAWGLCWVVGDGEVCLGSGAASAPRGLGVTTVPACLGCHVAGITLYPFDPLNLGSRGLWSPQFMDRED